MEESKVREERTYILVGGKPVEEVTTYIDYVDGTSKVLSVVNSIDAIKKVYDDVVPVDKSVYDLEYSKLVTQKELAIEQARTASLVNKESTQELKDKKLAALLRVGFTEEEAKLFL